jgi:hypothetical protein
MQEKKLSRTKPNKPEQSRTGNGFEIGEATPHAGHESIFWMGEFFQEVFFIVNQCEPV